MLILAFDQSQLVSALLFNYAKARVTPIKPVTIPRLELMAALVSVRISAALPKELIDKMWFKGPDFLWESKAPFAPCQIDNQPCLENDDPEVRAHEFNIIVEPTQKPSILDRLNYFSDWTRALRAIAHCLKYKEKLRERASTKEKDAMENQPALALIDLQKAKVKILKQIQKEAFSQELEDLSRSTRKTMDGGNRNDRYLRCTSPLYHLDPFLDEHYLLHVGGRLNKGSFCKDLKHPVILPRKSHVTELIISHFHQKLKHQGRSMTTNEIRQGGFWIIGCSSVVYTFISKCIICCKFRGKIQEQRMSDLPMDRIQPEPSFTYSGVDLFGPFYIKEG